MFSFKKLICYQVGAFWWHISSYCKLRCQNVLSVMPESYVYEIMDVIIS